MTCPACGAPTTALSLGGRMNTTVDIDLCAACGVIWFDRFEDVRLSPAGTLALFEQISGAPKAGAAPLARTIHCPRCGSALLLTHDFQQNTPFQYWRCDAGHGRLLTFLDFLREKAFIRPLTPQQIDELRQNVKTVNCANCGAPIDLARESVCGHCGSPLSLVDTQQMAREVAALRAAVAAGDRPVQPAPAPVDGRSPLNAHGSGDAMEMMSMLGNAEAAGNRSLIEIGLNALGTLLKRGS